jgi:4a-hydroxytetrahydrobiopterin dehydratase
MELQIMSETTRYLDGEADDRLRRQLPSWTVTDGHLSRVYKTNGWRTSMLLANGIAHLAEVAWHHPDLTISWGSVGVRLRTHDADAITDKDFELAMMIESYATWKPQDDSTLDGAPVEGEWRYVLDG